MGSVPVRLVVVAAWIVICSCQHAYGLRYLVVSSDGEQWSSFYYSPYRIPTNKSVFQGWANGITFKVNDELDFGAPVQLVRNSSDLCTSQKIGEVVESGLYTINNTKETGVTFGFISTEFCANGMQFTISVSTKKSHPPPQKAVLIGIAIGVSAVILIAGAGILFFRTRRRFLHKLSSWKSTFRISDWQWSASTARGVESPWAPQRFTYKQLSGATKSFSSSQVLGEGGFGTVYKGVLRDSGSPVAVKRLSKFARQGAREFMAEINIISQLRHRNLVQLLGWCDEKEELILVYEYMPNGDLDELIFGYGDGGGRHSLSWKQRYNILCGVANALVYLHEGWEQRVVHRDVKTANVMLDLHFNARLGDFGLARLSAHSQAPRTTLIAGTIGYLAPEFNLSGKATDKTDVYSFGIVALEVSCARRPLTSNCILVDWVWELNKEDKLLDAIDPNIDVRSTPDEEGMKRMLQVALLCCHPDPDTRPSMRQVLNFLTEEAPVPKLPRSKPVAYFVDFNE